MSENFYDIVQGTGRGIRTAWNTVSGVNMIRKRELDIKTNKIQYALFMFGLQVGCVGGIMTGMITESMTAALVVLGAGMSAPVTGFLPYAAYKAGEHDKKMRIGLENHETLEAPKKQLPAPGPEGLI
jgi:hypothetical protein